MAKAKAKRGNAVPKGYKAIGGFAQRWDVKKVRELRGEWGKVRKVTQKATRKGEKDRIVRVTDVTTDHGTYALWESAGLRALFDAAKAGDNVYIRFDGMGRAKRGQSAPKLYTVAIQE
jgi:hypothetical protein